MVPCWVNGKGRKKKNTENNNLVHDMNFKSHSQSTPWYYFPGKKSKAK